jgi:hypothetical protein
MIAPLLFLRPVLNVLLKLDLNPALYYVLCTSCTMAAMLAAVADYLWYAIYAARAERGLSRYAIPTIVLSLILVVSGAGMFGLVGASLGVLATNACVALFRARVLASHLARQMPTEYTGSSLVARLMPALVRVP